LSKIKVALVGVGNCASAFVQGLQYYSDREKEEECIGLRNIFLGDLHSRDIQIVAAFDVDSRKVGKDLSEAIFAPPNNTLKLVDVPNTEVTVHNGPVLDGVGEYTKNIVRVSRLSEANVASVLKESDAKIVVNLLPSGAIKASEWYAEQALFAQCAFVNTTPVFIASDAEWTKRFEEAELPLVATT